MKMRSNSARRRLGLGLLAASCALSVAACGDGEADSAEGGTTTLRFAHFLPPEHTLVVNGYQKFADEIEARTDGRVKFEFYPNEQLGKLADSLKILQAGTADIGACGAPYHPAEMPMTQALSLPLGMDLWTATGTMWRALHEESIFQQEHEDLGLVPVMVMGVEGYELSTKDTPVPDLDSVKGLRIRVGIPAHEPVVKALGASPVLIPTPEMTAALERGTVDGVYYSLPAWAGISLDETVHQSTENLRLTPSPGLNVCMGDAAWNKLSADDQKLFLEVGREASMNAIAVNKEANVEALAALKEGGLTTYSWSEEDLAEVQELMAPIADDWFQALEGDGGDAEEVRTQLEAFMSASEEAPEDWPTYTTWPQEAG
jgi:TRAP-type C4-dicarboxylate transport system substrate-binding protein